MTRHKSKETEDLLSYIYKRKPRTRFVEFVEKSPQVALAVVAGFIVGVFTRLPFAWFEIPEPAAKVVASVAGSAFSIFGALWLWTRQRRSNLNGLSAYIYTLGTDAEDMCSYLIDNIDDALADKYYRAAVGRLKFRFDAVMASLSQLPPQDCVDAMYLAEHISIVDNKLEQWGDQFNTSSVEQAVLTYKAKKWLEVRRSEIEILNEGIQHRNPFLHPLADERFERQRKYARKKEIEAEDAERMS